MCTHIPQCAVGVRGQLVGIASPFTVWVSEIELLSSSSLPVETSQQLPPHPPPPTLEAKYPVSQEASNKFVAKDDLELPPLGLTGLTWFLCF